MPLDESRFDSVAKIGLIKDWAPGADSGFAERVCLFTNTDGSVEHLCRTLRDSLAAHRLVFHPFSERSPIQEGLLSNHLNAKQILAEGFHRIIVLDISRAIDRNRVFDLAFFYQYAFAEFARAFGIAPSEAYHEEDMVQILRDEPTSLLCFLNAHLAPSPDRSRLRSLTQEKHHSLIVYRYISGTVTGLGDETEVTPSESHQLHTEGNVAADVQPFTKSDESERLERAIRGDRDALKELLMEYGPKVRLSIAARIPKRFRSRLSEDDVMQETYVDAFLNVNEFQSLSENCFAIWLAKIAKNHILDTIQGLNALERGEGWHLFKLLSEVERDFGLSDVGRKNGDRFESDFPAIDKLPEDLRRVVEMCDQQGRPIAEVASILGRSQGAVLMLRKRAHRRLLEIMGLD